jgi:hypothetical protein
MLERQPNHARARPTQEDAAGTGNLLTARASLPAFVPVCASLRQFARPDMAEIHKFFTDKQLRFHNPVFSRDKPD